jgi:hypothetical protein
MQALETLIAVRTSAPSSATGRFIVTLLHVQRAKSARPPQSGAQKLVRLKVSVRQ